MKKVRSVQVFLFPAASGLALYRSPDSPKTLEIREKDRRNRYIFRAEIPENEERKFDLSFVLSQVRIAAWLRRYQ